MSYIIKEIGYFHQETDIVAKFESKRSNFIGLMSVINYKEWLTVEILDFALLLITPELMKNDF